MFNSDFAVGISDLSNAFIASLTCSLTSPRHIGGQYPWIAFALLFKFVDMVRKANTTNSDGAMTIIFFMYP